MMMLAGLAVIFLSCEKEVSERGANKEVAVIFSVNRAGYGASDEARSSFDARKLEPTVVPLGNDIYLYATLEPDSTESLSDELRASPLLNKQKIRLAAFNKTTGLQEGSAATYTYTGGKLVPDGLPLGVEPDDGTIYRFVAYSYFGDPETDPVETGIEPSQDLVWGVKEQPITDTEAGRTVSITMDHRFSRVRVKLKANQIPGAKITAIGTVQVTGRQVADLEIESGDVTAAGASAMPDVGWSSLVSPFSETNILSDYDVFFPSPTGVTISSITIELSDQTVHVFTDISAAFSQPLTAATNYTLVVDLKRFLWAQSNIYWDDSLNEGTGGMTFQKPGDTPDHSDYQGVYFVWGSLVGLSPGGQSATRFVYIPPVNGVEHWSKTSPGDSPWPGWGVPVPLVESNYKTLYRDYADFDNYIGDICSYLTDGAWRMPGHYEGSIFGSRISLYTEFYDPNDPTGQGEMGNRGGWFDSAASPVFFPASGAFGPYLGYSNNAGASGYYATGYSPNPTQFEWFRFDAGGVTYNYYQNRTSNGYPVRCVTY